MTPRKAAHYVTIALFALASVECGKSSSENEDSNDGTAATGGSATGGSATGGSATGGSATGGSSTGGSATGGYGTGGSGTGGSNTTGGSSTGGSSTGGTGGGDLCVGAAPMQPCPTEGQACGACDNPCNFCNLMVCTSGFWQRFEGPPAPCFDCGTNLRCQSYETYCRIEEGAALVEECAPIPSDCDTDVTCACLSPLNPDFTCSGSTGEVTLTRSGG